MRSRASDRVFRKWAADVRRTCFKRLGLDNDAELQKQIAIRAVAEREEEWTPEDKFVENLQQRRALCRSRLKECRPDQDTIVVGGSEGFFRFQVTEQVPVSREEFEAWPEHERQPFESLAREGRLELKRSVPAGFHPPSELYLSRPFVIGAYYITAGSYVDLILNHEDETLATAVPNFQRVNTPIDFWLCAEYKGATDGATTPDWLVPEKDQNPELVKAVEELCRDLERVEDIRRQIERGYAESELD
jgi:hypothetical protein